MKNKVEQELNELVVDITNALPVYQDQEEMKVVKDLIANFVKKNYIRKDLVMVRKFD